MLEFLGITAIRKSKQYSSTAHLQEIEKKSSFSCPAWFVKHQGTLYLLAIFFSYFFFNNWISISLSKKNLNFQRYNFLIGILDVCRIPRIYLNAKINFITSLRLLFYSESMRESSPYIKYSMLRIEEDSYKGGKKAVDPDIIPTEVWKCLGDSGIDIVWRRSSFRNKFLLGEEWVRSYP